MEFSLFNFSFPPLVVTFSVTLLCCLLTILFSLRFSFRKPKSLEAESTASCSKIKSCSCSCSCSCNGVVLSGADYSASLKAADTYANGGTIAAGGMGENGPVVLAAGATVAERQTGASMMEQLVPEITTHALSYLDYPSLCRLSMTNSQMRKAANDDNAWKALYHKDYTLEQDGVRPANGWKAYYAATRAIVNINAEFFNIIRDRSLSAMSCFWLNADYVKCIHASGELFSGYNAVMQSWQIAFNWEQQQGNGLQIRDVRTRVLTDMAWVTMKTYVDMDTVPYNVTNVFEFHNGRWYMVHHHCSLMLADGDDDQQIVHA
ncbi:F-box protein skip8 [Ancistrocladus abbreviatus]